MESIDINTILAQENMNVISNSYKDKITLKDLMKKLESNLMIVTNKNVEKSKLQYFVHYNKDELLVLEKKNDKKRRFIYQVQKKMFIINHRRAQKNEIKEMMHRLTIYSKLLNNHKQSYISDKQEDIQATDNDALIKLVMNYSEMLNLKQKKLYHANLSKNHELLLANYLKSFSNIIRKKTSEKNRLMVINYFKEIADYFVTNDNSILITNKADVTNTRAETRYTMIVKKENIKLTEKNISTKNEFVIDLANNTLMLNHEQMKESALNWLLSKCMKISADIESGKATVFQGNNNDRG